MYLNTVSCVEGLISECMLYIYAAGHFNTTHTLDRNTHHSEIYLHNYHSLPSQTFVSEP